MIEDDIYGEIIKLINEETMYLRHYVGEVVDTNDILKKGRVKITLPMLGLDTPALGLWCNPRQGNALIIPEIGQWAEVYFIDGDRENPAYLYPASEIKDNTLKSYTGNVLEKIIFEDFKSRTNNLKYNQTTKEFVVNSGVDYAVKYLELKIAFDQLKTDHDAIINLLQTWVVAPNDGGAALQAAAAALAPSTADMTNSKVEKVRLP